jgi:hypothetical protein
MGIAAGAARAVAAAQARRIIDETIRLRTPRGHNNNKSRCSLLARPPKKDLKESF